LSEIKEQQQEEAAAAVAVRENKRQEREDRKSEKEAELEADRGRWRECNPGMHSCVCRYRGRFCAGGLHLCGVCNVAKKRMCKVKACVDADTEVMQVLNML